MINFKEAPVIQDNLIGFLDKLLSTDNLLAESNREGISGLEQLGYIKGARHALGLLKAVKNFQENEEI